MLARTVTHALVGLEARRVEVEAHLQLGVPGFAIVGLADRACQEAKERVRVGIASAELEWPVRRITVNLAPAGLRKEGSGFDLPIALAVLAASHQLPAGSLEGVAAFGELALDGRVRPGPGALIPAEGGARAKGARALVCAPDHWSWAPAMVGGGAAPPRPGEASLAHRGVLFLDELPEFARPVLEALRQPLEDGVVTVSRVGGRAVFPARFQLVAAMNLCPCGARGDPAAHCSCAPDRVHRYREKLSRALLDRFDLTLTVPRARASELAGPPGEGSDVVRVRVVEACRRLEECPPPLGDAAQQLLTRAVERLPL